MPDRYVWSGGSNTSPYETWAKAATSPITAINAAAAGEKVYVHAADYTPSGNETWVLAGTIGSPVVVICSNDTTNMPPQTVGSGWRWTPGTSAYDLAINGIGVVYGLTFHVSGGSGTTTFSIAQTDDDDIRLVNCGFNAAANTSASSVLILCGDTIGNMQSTLENFTYVSSNQAAGGIEFQANVKWVGGSVTTTAANTVLVKAAKRGCEVSFANVDFDGMTSGTVVNPSTGAMTTNTSFVFSNCRFHASATLVGSFAAVATADITFYNCGVGDVHYQFAHYSPYGMTLVDTGIYASDGAEWNESAAKYSWKIVTGGNCSHQTPYVSPWIHQHHEGTSAITPSLEGFRDGSTSVIEDDEVWAEFSYQGTSGFTLGTIVNDRMALLGSPADQTSSLTYSDWETGTSADSTFKLATTATITPAEIGNLSARVCVGEPSITVYVDPQIRT